MSVSKTPPAIERIIALANEPMALLDKAFTVICSNASFQTKFNLSEFATSKNRNFLEIIDSSFDTVSLKLLFLDVLKTKETIKDYGIHSKNSPNNKITFNIETIDIDGETFLLLAFNNYRETEQLQSFLQSVLNSTNYGIASYEPIYKNDDSISDFRITYTNPEVPRNFGLEPKDVIGKTCCEVYPGIFNNGIFEKMVKCIETGLPDNYEIAVSHNNKTMWLSATIEKAGHAVAVTSKNITPEKTAALEIEAINILLSNKNKELEQQLLKEFSESFYSYGSGDAFFNSLLLEIAQKTKMDYVLLGEVQFNELGEEIIKSISVIAFGKVADNFKYQIKDGPCDEVIRGNYACHPRDSQKLFPESRTLADLDVEGYIAYPLIGSSGKVIGLIAVLHQSEIYDITYIESLLKIAAKRSEMEFERLQNEKLLEMKNKELERQNVELASFAYISSHDLQEPLRKIQLFASRILFREKANFSDSSLAYFQSITNAANRMQNLIESLLNYSSMDASDIYFVPTDLNAAIDDIKNNMTDVLEKKNARVEVGKLPMLSVIPIQFQQLLTNLISNGIKYSKADVPPVIKINAELVSSEEFTGKKFWKLDIADNGIGFPQEYEQQIFELFKRLHGRSDYEGTGIGLAICKKIVQKHDGFIRAHGIPGVGSVFSVYLPAE
ncbi:ATP-binding protein [Flavobacterium microcysteis]|uniref:histidine kinase n=1 Tax=Flavobacterium microcysteis TaxID=2596891 RepID=A0A501Q5S1_9FLAO|nr:ATP-binding protein [Flavobacterium microcysteis]TPD67261.1 hypothetical protein FJA49_13380 [Flavobacterium microcysteis]